jgi:hypothetical protein
MRALKASSIYSFSPHNVTISRQLVRDSLDGLVVKAYLPNLEFDVASHNRIESKLGNLG